MPGLQRDDAEEQKLDSVREKLYERGVPEKDLGYTDLRAHASHDTPPPAVWQARTHEEVRPPAPAAPLRTSTPPFVLTTPMKKRTRSRFRGALLGGGVLFFLVAAILASTYLFFGRNSISGNNITLLTHGPFAVGGGSKFDFTATLTNQNIVPIDSATLIMEYPVGTQSATEKGKGMVRERKTIEHIGPGETLNIPLSAIVFGEENDEKDIRVTIEYRVQGSNATFYRDATPLHFKISSSPVTMSVDAVKQITSGQNIDFAITVSSNSPSPLEGLLVKADYPPGFSFTTSNPKPVAGEDTWLLSELKPGEKKVVHITGLMSGKDPEKKTFRFSSGVANDQDPYSLSSVFTTFTHEVALEAAFVGLDMQVNGKGGDTVALSPREAALIEVTFKNTLPDTIYDTNIQVQLSGNAIDKSTVSAGSGFYDSSKNTITWDSAGTDGLKEIIPGGSNTVTFSFTPAASEDTTRTQEVVATVNVNGRRVSETNVPQKLTSALSRSVKVESETTLSSQVFFGTGPFSNTGPVPPVAEQPTTYTVIMAYRNGANGVANAAVEAQLPQYVTWTDQTKTPAGKISYNATTRMMTWNIGDVDAGKVVGGAFQVSILPSASQVSQVPALVLEQRARAQDRFTGTTLRATAPNLTTQLSDETDESKQAGRVLPAGSH